MEKEAYLYHELDRGKVLCLTCQRKCIIPEGQKGWCQTRENKDGKLYSLIYGEVSTLSINPIEKKPVFHFYPGSRWLSLGIVGCNFRCPGCQNSEIAHWKKGKKYTEYLPPKELVSKVKAAGCIGISFTFNEPALWFEYTVDAARFSKAHGLYTSHNLRQSRRLDKTVNRSKRIENHEPPKGSVY
jgi:pyruvate formate lyase activating enzyme